MIRSRPLRGRSSRLSETVSQSTLYQIRLSRAEPVSIMASGICANYVTHFRRSTSAVISFRQNTAALRLGVFGMTGGAANLVGSRSHMIMIWNMEPRPNSDSHQVSPPSKCDSSRVIASPRPVPGTELSTCEKAWKSLCICSCISNGHLTIT